MDDFRPVARLAALAAALIEPAAPGRDDDLARELPRIRTLDPEGALRSVRLDVAETEPLTADSIAAYFNDVQRAIFRRIGTQDLQGLVDGLPVIRGRKPATGVSWHAIAPMPDREGFAGSFGGVSGGALVVAGGANFPEGKPWEGGRKAWHDRVYVLESPGGPWRVAGKLPRPLGYGVSVSHGGGVVCVGGGDATGNSAEAFRLDWRGGELVTTRLPPLPVPTANAAGALVGDRLYVAGGQERPDAAEALRRAWAIDLSAAEPAWAEVEPWPGPGRMLAVAAGCNGAFWIAGGVALARQEGGGASRVYLRDAYRYEPGRGWARVADLPRPCAAAASPAPADGKGFLVLGGDDGEQVGVDPLVHPGFRAGILRYDLTSKAWLPAGTLPAPRVTVPCVPWRGELVVPGGEVRPGVRSPEVWSRRPANEEL